MRGKGQLLNHFLTGCRITPAYAGKSHALKKFTELTGDHPRLCGEKPDGYYKAKDITGSPPPMRGKGRLWTIHADDSGITPAYAGKRLRW